MQEVLALTRYSFDLAFNALSFKFSEGEAPARVSRQAQAFSILGPCCVDLSDPSGRHEHLRDYAAHVATSIYALKEAILDSLRQDIPSIEKQTHVQNVLVALLTGRTTGGEDEQQKRAYQMAMALHESFVSLDNAQVLQPVFERTVVTLSNLAREEMPKIRMELEAEVVADCAEMAACVMAVLAKKDFQAVRETARELGRYFAFLEQAGAPIRFRPHVVSTSPTGGYDSYSWSRYCRMRARQVWRNIEAMQMEDTLSLATTKAVRRIFTLRHWLRETPLKKIA